MWVIRLRTLYVCIERSIGADLIIGEVLLKIYLHLLSPCKCIPENISATSYTIPCGSKTHSSKRPPYCYVILRRVTAGQRELCPSIRLNPSLHIWGTLARESPCAQLLRNYINILWLYSCPCCYQAGYRSLYCPIPCTKESLNVMTTKHICSVWLWTTQFTLSCLERL